MRRRAGSRKFQLNHTFGSFALTEENHLFCCSSRVLYSSNNLRSLFNPTSIAHFQFKSSKPCSNISLQLLLRGQNAKVSSMTSPARRLPTLTGRLFLWCVAVTKIVGYVEYHWRGTVRPVGRSGPHGGWKWKIHATYEKLLMAQTGKANKVLSLSSFFCAYVCSIAEVRDRQHVTGPDESPISNAASYSHSKPIKFWCALLSPRSIQLHSFKCTVSLLLLLVRPIRLNDIIEWTIRALKPDSRVAGMRKSWIQKIRRPTSSERKGGINVSRQSEAILLLRSLLLLRL